MKQKPSNIPFSLDKTSRNTLSDQMENALRRLIVSGRYRPGDTLPTIRDWAKMLGVSMRVPEAVIPKLVREGLVIARPRHGCIVAPRNASIFSGHVLLVTPPSDHVYAANIMCGQITRQLEDAGYLVTRATVRVEDNGKMDLARLNLALRQSVDLAVLVYENPVAAHAAADACVPFFWFGSLSAPKGAVDCVVYSHQDALRHFLAGCPERGIRRVELVVKDYSRFPPPVSLKEAREIDFRTMTVPVDARAPRPGSIAEGAMTAFCKRIARPHAKLPDLFLFTDDYLFQGALPVLMKSGVDIPEHLKLATFSNRGNGPVAPIPFDRIENDPIQNGERVAMAILRYLKTGRHQEPITLCARHVRG